MPANFIRKQTLKNAERYITPELKEYEEKVLTADERAKELEYELFVELRDAVRRGGPAAAGHGRRAGPAGRAWRRWPNWPASAATAGRRSSTEPVLEIVDGRHPVLDIIEPAGTFVPNDTLADPRCRHDPADHRARTWPARAPTSARSPCSR